MKDLLWGRIEDRISENLIREDGRAYLIPIQNVEIQGLDESSFYLSVWEEWGIDEMEEALSIECRDNITSLLHDAFRDGIPDEWTLVHDRGVIQEWISPSNDWAKIQFSDNRVYLWLFLSGQY